MARMRVVLSGMGGQLGTRVTNMLEDVDTVEAVIGIDVDPPRRRIPKAEFHRIDPRDRRKIVAVVRDFEPTAVLHLGVYEPDARVVARRASVLTDAMALAVLGAATQSPALDRIVVRSGIEVYGRARGMPARPDETVTARPTTPWGATLSRVEQIAAEGALAAGVPLAVLRMAPVVGPHMPSPLGRCLRLPSVPVGALSDPPFSLLHQEDAAAAVVRALESGVDATVNVVGAGAVTPVQAARMGGRLPTPLLGPAWRVAAAVCELWGAPLPAHVRELLLRGRCADGDLVGALLGFTPEHSTPSVVRDLYEWADVVHLEVGDRRAA